MKHFVAILKMKDEEKNKQFRPAHLKFLEEKHAQGDVMSYGAFTDGSGGMVIYRGDNIEVVTELAKQDPLIVEGGRELEIKEWIMKP